MKKKYIKLIIGILIFTAMLVGISQEKSEKTHHRIYFDLSKFEQVDFVKVNYEISNTGIFIKNVITWLSIILLFSGYSYYCSGLLLVSNKT